MRWLPLLLLVAACGGSPSTSNAKPTPGPSAPLLLDRPIWDAPLDDSAANKLLERVRETLADNPPVPTGTDPKEWSKPVIDWVERRLAQGKVIRADFEGLVGRPDPRMQLLATVALAVTLDDFAMDMMSIQPPAEVRSGEFGADIEKVFRETMAERAMPLSAMARTAFDRCGELATQTPVPTQPWGAYCRERSTKLAAIEAQVGARRGKEPSSAARRKRPAVLADCDTRENWGMAPNALPPDKSVNPAVAYIYDGTEITGADVATLEIAVAKQLGAETNMPVVDGKELAAARKLVTQRRLHARGPTCGQAPPLTAIVAHKRKHLVIGTIRTTCIYDAPAKMRAKPRCGLMVSYSRAGDTDHDGLPGAMFAPVSSQDAPASDYIAAAPSLAPHKAMAGLLGRLGSGEQVLVELKGFGDEDPWLRVSGTLHDITAAKLQSCVDGPASFDATFTVSPVGKASSIALTPVTAPAAGTKVADCVKQALEATPWPCTRDGKPAPVAVRMCVAPR